MHSVGVGLWDSLLRGGATVLCGLGCAPAGGAASLGTWVRVGVCAGGSWCWAEGLYAPSRTMVPDTGFERVSGGEFRDTLFIAFRSGTRRFVVAADNAIDVARLLLAWAELGRDVAVLSSFADRGEALSWLALPAIDLPSWVALTCAVDPDDGVIFLDEGDQPTPVFALLCGAGGQVVSEANTAEVPRLVNTLKALNGERAIARMLPSMRDAETWLLSPRVPRWVVTPLPTEASESTAAPERLHDAADPADDDVVFVSGGADSESISSGISSGALFSEAVRALPPPPPPRPGGRSCPWEACATACSCLCASVATRSLAWSPAVAVAVVARPVPVPSPRRPCPPPPPSTAVVKVGGQPRVPRPQPPPRAPHRPPVLHWASLCQSR